MKDVLRSWLDRMTTALIDWLLDVVLSDKIAWLETKIESLPDELIKSQAHEQALDRPFIYPVTYPDGEGDDENDVISLATVVADLSERVTMMEARLAEMDA